MAKNKRTDRRPSEDTMQLGAEPIYKPTADALLEEDADLPFKDDPAAETASDSFEEEYSIEADRLDAQMQRKYDLAERVLGIVTTVLAVLLLLGSLAFWLYFCLKLSRCAPTLNNWRLYSGMLICCAAIPAILAAAQFFLHKPVSAEKWLVNMCLSGVITAAFLLVMNSAILGNAFSFSDVPTLLCFSVSGCALPAALYMVIRLLLTRLVGSIKRARALDGERMRRDVLALSSGWLPNQK